MAIIGIDLGTSNSAAAVLRGGRPVIIPSAEGISLGGKAFPSFVAVTPEGQMLVGEPARRQVASNPEGTATAFKRRMGRRETIKLRDREFSPEQLSAFLLQKIKRDAEAFLGEPVTQAVVTVPAYFDDNQRGATKDACRIAGLEVARLVNEPTAAALAYGLDRLGQELRIAVIDFGGGTLDVTIMEFGKGVFEVKATSGDTQLGGTDMNQRLFEYLADRFKGHSEIDVRSDRRASARLLEAAEVAKIELTTATTAYVNLPFIAAVNGQACHLELDLTRAEMERVVMPVIATPLVTRNTPIPVKHGEIFTTAADMQTSVTIHVFQGERPMAADNVSLGQFNLDGLPPAPRGIPKIDVTFDLDSNGILNVSAKDTATGKSQSIRITGSTRLSDAEKQRMIDQATRYAEEDRKRREQADLLNAADSTCYQAEKLLAEHGAQLSADLKNRVESSLRDTREAVVKRDAKLAAEREEQLKRVVQEAGATLYAQAPRGAAQTAAGTAGAKTAETPSGQRVVDAEFHERR